MNEIAEPENEELVSRVYTRALEDRADGRPLDAAAEMVYQIEMLSQEVNSGASFESWFRWASVSEIAEAARRLETLALHDVAKLVRRAIAVAFPDGIPASDDEKSERTDWDGEQESALAALAEEFEAWNGRILNVLAEFHRRSGPRV